MVREDKRRSSPAVPPRERLVAIYLACYRGDLRFRSALVDLYTTHKASLADLARRDIRLQPDHFWKSIPDISSGTMESIAAIEAFARQWKLDVLFPEGNDELCGWLMSCQTAWRQTIVPVEDERGNIIPGLRFDEDSPENEPNVDDFGIRFGIPSILLREPDIEYDADEMCCVVRLNGDRIGTCAPELETVAAVKKRLSPLVPRDSRTALFAEVERIYAKYIDEGYETPDTAGKLQRHMTWLYRRIIHGERCEKIAANEAGDERNVRNQTDRLADALHLEISRVQGRIEKTSR